VLSDVQAELGKLSKAVDCGVCRVITGPRRLNLPTLQRVVCARDCSASTHFPFDSASSRFRAHICLPVCCRTTRLKDQPRCYDCPSALEIAVHFLICTGPCAGSAILHLCLPSHRVKPVRSLVSTCSPTLKLAVQLQATTASAIQHCSLAPSSTLVIAILTGCHVPR